MNHEKTYRSFIGGLLVLGLAGLCCCSWDAQKEQIPDQVFVSEYGEIPALFHGIAKQIIKTEVEEQETADVREVVAKDEGNLIEENDTSYTVSCRLFGVLPLKSVAVSVVPRSEVYVGGSPIGIYLETDGVLVVDTAEITGADGTKSAPAQNIVKSGDYIREVNGTAVSTKEELIDCIAACGGKAVVLEVERDGTTIDLQLQPVQDQQGSYKAGIWVRNDTQGIGTLTYVDQEGRFGALGHGISDIDTGELLEVSGGTLYEADVVSVVKGRQGTPGEVAGIIHYNAGYKIGTITENRSDGIYGSVSSLASLSDKMQLYETAHPQEVECGPATILCCVEGVTKEYEAKIKEVRLTGSDTNKSLVIEVTDPKLLELTGGIIQGMSGSPILQGGRIVGAVTHVFVNDPTKGYGIFIENMLQ